MRREIAWSDNAITLLDEIYNFTARKVNPQPFVYTTGYSIQPNL